MSIHYYPIARDQDPTTRAELSLWTELTRPLGERDTDEGWRRERAEALRNSSLGLGLLTCCVAVRMLVFKL